MLEEEEREESPSPGVDGAARSRDTPQRSGLRRGGGGIIAVDTLGRLELGSPRTGGQCTQRKCWDPGRVRANPVPS